jgi:hypothetical protein
MRSIARLSAALLFALATPLAQAAATLHIGDGYPGTCATGSCPIYDGEVNNIGVGLDVYQNSGGASPLMNPLLVILGVPNDTSGSALGAGTLTSATLYDGSSPAPVTISFGTDAFGLNNGSYWNWTGGQNDVYSFLGLSGADNSNSFTNWANLDSAVDGINASSFGIYVFALSTASGQILGANDYLDITTNGLPEGTFAVAYGESSTTSGKTSIYATPFTQAGNVDRPTPVPEPMTLSLVGVALAGLGYGARKRSNPTR